MTSKYPSVVNRNFRDSSTVWTWHELSKEWLSLAEQHKLEEKCRTSTPAAIRLESR
jgi:hypothetical protein